MNTYETFIKSHTVDGFSYNEDTREHFLNGKIIPSVSRVVEPLSFDYSKIHPITLKGKQDLGVQFHKLVELYIRDDLENESEFIEEVPQLRLPFEAFKEYWLSVDKADDAIPLAVEQALCHPKLMYCGKPDYIKETATIDWKLRPYDPVCDPVRMAGYAGLVSDFPKKKLTVVSFDLKGNRKIHDAEKKGAWGMFRELLKHYWGEIEFTELLENWRKSCQ